MTETWYILLPQKSSCLVLPQSHLGAASPQRHEDNSHTCTMAKTKWETSSRHGGQRQSSGLLAYQADTAPLGTRWKWEVIQGSLSTSLTDFHLLFTLEFGSYWPFSAESLWSQCPLHFVCPIPTHPFRLGPDILPLVPKEGFPHPAAFFPSPHPTVQQLSVYLSSTPHLAVSSLRTSTPLSPLLPRCLAHGKKSFSTHQSCLSCSSGVLVYS